MLKKTTYGLSYYDRLWFSYNDSDMEEHSDIRTELVVFDSEVVVIDSEVAEFDSEMVVIDSEVVVIYSGMVVIDSEVVVIYSGMVVIDSEVVVFDTEMVAFDSVMVIFDSEKVFTVLYFRKKARCANPPYQLQDHRATAQRLSLSSFQLTEAFSASVEKYIMIKTGENLVAKMAASSIKNFKVSEIFLSLMLCRQIFNRDQISPAFSTVKNFQSDKP